MTWIALATVATALAGLGLTWLVQSSALLALGLVAGRTLMNGRITWKSASLEWETVAGATNLTNKFYYINKVFGAVPTNITEGQPGAPREWFVTLRRNF